MKLIVLNHKMNLTYDSAVTYVDRLVNIDAGDNKVVVVPSYPYLSLFSNKCLLGSQNVSRYASGSYTGEVSASQLKSLGVSYCLVGHSERRTYFKESNLDVAEKIKCLLSQEIIPILCVGETMEERANNETKKVLLEQLIPIFDFLSTEDVQKIVVAYEPIWAIGTGDVPTNDEIREMIIYIKETLFNRYHQSIQVLYGGSISPSNITKLHEIDELDGYLIGGASLDLTKVEMIIKKEVSDN